MDRDIPMFDAEDPDLMKKLTVAMADHSNVCIRNRPYIGQPQTDAGERGKQMVEGLTMRDIADCIVMGAIDCCGIEQPELYDSLNDDHHATREMLYQIDWTQVDPGAVIQNAMCHIEKRMGIYPNVHRLEIEGDTP